ncbi:PREDICTED: josephin-like protein [Nelumbo nucifera]|uniref:Josephin-like protein n=2 Tax=Nelumbo nucifera TaxID=4432 RepID=A0A1U8A4C3_NELNU|nr:PREDICTED: josephin-like protein [Nelumbo nucifera]DAD26656.1 TPA_asm: hypothetical protein HUJ06_028124 [Nelumbo nucifera]
MSRKPSDLGNFAHTDIKGRPTVLLKQSSSKRVAGNRDNAGTYSFRLPKSLGFSPVRFLRSLGDKVARVLQRISTRGRRSSSKVSSSNSRSRPLAASFDSHRSEAIEDCIEFINSSASFQRSNSVSTN